MFRGQGRESTDHIREPAQLTPRNALDHHSQSSSPVPRPHGDAVDRAKDFCYAVAGHVEHGGCDDAFGVRETCRWSELAMGIETVDQHTLRVGKLWW